MSSKKNGAEESRLNIDFEQFEKEIDNEIDQLFVPFEDLPVTDSSAVLEEPAALFVKEKAPEPPMEKVPSSGTGEGLEGVSLQEAIPTIVEKEEAAAPVASHPAIRKEPELTTLVESFSVAYLSLDWDFAAENIFALDLALERLEPYCQKQPETLSLYRILKAVLQRMKSRPDSASARFSELISHSQDLLKRMLVSEGSPGPAEREELRSLLRRVQSIKEESMKEEMKAKVPVSEPQPFMIAEKALEPAAIPFRTREAAVAGSQTLGDFKGWMLAYHDQICDILNGFQEESNRLFLLEEILEKKPALAPLTARLNRIRSTLERRLITFREKEQEWLDRIDWIDEFEKGMADQGSIAVKPVLPGPAAVAEEAEAVSSAPRPEAFQSEAEVQREQVCMFALSGKRFGIAASHVVKTEQISARKVKKIMNRGYATLADFKPFLKDIRTGVCGAWLGLPASALKDYQFLPLPQESLRAPEDPSPPKRVILVSDGRRHGMILTESEGIDLHNEVLGKEAGNEGVLGVMKTESGALIEVLDLDFILRKVYQE